MPESVVLLHGFGGTRRAWDGVVAHLHTERYLPLALDLPGHGDAAHVRPIDFQQCVARVLASAPERFALCGYSLGGRVALHVALAAPERVARLVLVSCSAGIEDPGERAARSESDHRLADELQRIPYEDFIERWRGQALFADEPPEVGRLAREDQRRNGPDGLAAALLSLGAGEMEPLWERLGELTMPVHVLAGDRDAKYRALGERMAGLLPNGGYSVVGGGHALLLESPQAVAGMID